MLSYNRIILSLYLDAERMQVVIFHKLVQVFLYISYN
jgi:hypothetical protein